VGATFRSIFHCWNEDYVKKLGRGKVKLRKGDDPDDHVRRHFRWSLFRAFPAGTDKKVIEQAEVKAKLMLGSRAEYLGMNAN